MRLRNSLWESLAQVCTLIFAALMIAAVALTPNTEVWRRTAVALLVAASGVFGILIGFYIGTHRKDR